MSEEDANFVREKWLKEIEFRERETKIKEQEASVKEGELAIKRKESSRNWITGPLSLALIAATIAGFANVWVSYHNGDAQRMLAQTQAEHKRISDAINGEEKAALDKLKFLLGAQLITEEPTRTNIRNYIDQKPLDQTTKEKTSHTETPPQSTATNQQGTQKPPENAPIAEVNLQSTWLDGGTNPTSVCGELSGSVKDQYPGKTVKLAGSSQRHKKDFLGHVTYQYFCNFEVYERP